MKNQLLPKNYKPLLSLIETEKAIKTLKDFFERNLAQTLNLNRVSAPLFLPTNSGLNDNLNGYENPVEFNINALPNEKIEIIHSLAKWKRLALKRYGYLENEGLYTDMNAIRTAETLDNLHSIYVDQWDWEKIISTSNRSFNFLQVIVKDIYKVFKNTEQFINSNYENISPKLPNDIYFISTQELEDRFPTLSPKEREHAITKEHKAVFLHQIGNTLKSGKKHDGRAPDYDDWNLNGDILFWYPLLNTSIELSSMGIRVDSTQLKHQLEKENCLNRLNFSFHKELSNNNLPQTIGGGIGQSRICMFFLQKAHIGEVQSSIWTPEIIKTCYENNIDLL